MTRPFNVQYSCSHCGKRSTAETAFGRWMRNNAALDSVTGVVRTDLDHIICRYTTSLQGRDFQLMMVIEVKEHGAEPDACQTDLLSFLRQLAERKSVNMHGAQTIPPIRVHSKMIGRKVLLRWFGVHLLQFQNTDPVNSVWIKWNRKTISPQLLTALLAMERHPLFTDMPMIEYLRDRHASRVQSCLELPKV